MIYAGIYVVDAPNHHAWLPQISSASQTKLLHTASRTLLTQTFVNPSTVSPIASSKYTFPLYESCAVVSFRCHIGTCVIEGTIKEKEEASATYQAAIERSEPASLLEQHTTDVFSTSLGNIGAGEKVKVEIEYIMELKHDAEVDGLRFTIPTSVAPRYGVAPSGLGSTVPVVGEGMKISVEVSMPSNITLVQSPSHPVSVYLGGHSSNPQSSNTFNPQYALAQLGQTSTALSADFVLLIKCASLSSPSAILETHPTIPNTSALMVTLVPKFNLPPEPTQPEVVFVVDQSGSMEERVPALKSSLRVFLKSLPVGVLFNICSFGSSHSFLWPRSRAYNALTFAEAQRYCDGIQSNFGGTDILSPIRSTIINRLPSTNLEIMVLTDGEVWNSTELFDYVESQTSTSTLGGGSGKGDIRVFTLGIGQDVSHALVDGLARVGKGFSQVVVGEKEGIEAKVIRMLRGALSVHVGDYRLEWEGKPSDEEAPTAPSVLTSTSFVPTPSATPRNINLFDPSYIEPPHAISPPPLPSLPPFTPPHILQAPYTLQPLFPFSRSTVYVILASPNVPPPMKVWLRGTTPSGDLLELEIPVQHSGSGAGDKTIHQLAARKVLGELKDGTSYLHHKYKSITGDIRERGCEELVKREGVRVGLEYGVASEWTSFVAVVKREENEQQRREREQKEEGREEAFDFINIDAEKDSDSGDGLCLRQMPALCTSPCRNNSPVPQQPTGIAAAMRIMASPPPPPITYPTTIKYKTASSAPFSKTGGFTSIGMIRGKAKGNMDGLSEPSLSRFKSSVTPSANAIPYTLSNALPGHLSPSETGAQSLSPRTKALIDMQTYEGSFNLDSALAALLGVSMPDLEAKLAACFVSGGGNWTSLSEEQKRKVWATLSAIRMSETRLASERDVWGLVVDKARAWVRTMMADGDVKALEKLMGDVLGI